MNKSYLLLLVLVLSHCAYSQKKNSIAIAFYNCENFFDTQHNPAKDDADFTPEGRFHYTEKIYHEKLHNIANVLKSMANEDASGLVITGLAEVENEQVLNDLVNQGELKDYHYGYILYDGPDRNGLNVALLYEPEIFRPLLSYPIHVNYLKESLRDILYVKGLLSGDTVHVFVNHWTSGRTGEQNSRLKRIASAIACHNKTDSLLQNNPASNIIIMGDLNTNPDDSVITNLLGAKTEKSAMSSAFYNPWLSIYKSGRGSLEYLDHWDLFDQILLSGSFLKLKALLHFEKAIIFKKDFMVDHNKRFLGYPHSSFAGTQWVNGYSDHFPVMIYLTAH